MEATERCRIWEEFKDRIKQRVVWMRRERDKENKIKSWMKSLEILLEKVNTQRDPRLQQLVELMEKKWSSEEKTLGTRNMARVVMPAKVPTWTNNMTLEMFKRQLE